VKPCLVTDHLATLSPARAVQDRNRTFRRAYRAPTGAALLIRPDGYVAWRASAPNADVVAGHLDGTARSGGHP
jgi:hypothetical protein